MTGLGPNVYHEGTNKYLGLIKKAFKVWGKTTRYIDCDDDDEGMAMTEET